MTTNGYGKINFADVEDSAPKFGMGELGEARFLRADVGAETIGMSLYRMNPNMRTGFGHRHEHSEEMYFVLSGSGRVKVGDDILEVTALDVVRVAPSTMREFEAGPDGMEVLATGGHADDDSEMKQDFWPRDDAA